jgi:hypothetical protein
MHFEIYAATLREAQADLERVRVAFESLRKEKEALEGLIECLSRLVPDQPQLPMEMPARETFNLPAEKERGSRKSPNGTRKLAIDALKRVGRALTVPEIHNYIVSVVGGIAPKRESIRVLMIRHSATFEQQGDGLYGLRKGYELEVDEEAVA